VSSIANLFPHFDLYVALSVIEGMYALVLLQLCHEPVLGINVLLGSYDSVAKFATELFHDAEGILF
jgi:hypothetical protein